MKVETKVITLNMSDLADLKLTGEQEKAVSLIKAAVLKRFEGDSDISDRRVARFYRSLAFDQTATEDAIVKYLEWRVEKKIDNVLDKMYPNADKIKKIIAHTYHGVDKEGRPVYYEKTGKICAGALCQHVSPEDFLQSHIYGMEYLDRKCVESSKTLGKTVDTFCTVLDLSGLSMSASAAIPFLTGCSELDKNYYPEKVGRVLVINAPYIFPVLFNMVKGLMPQSIIDSVKVLSDVSELLDYIPKDQLPTEYGGEGKCEIVEQDCSDMLSADYDDGYDKDNVPAGSQLTKVLECKEPSTFTWYFHSTGAYDVDFSVRMYPIVDGKVSTKATVVQEKTRVVSQRGSYVSKVPVRLVIEWDNAYSYFTSKDIKYLCDVSDVIME